MGKTTKATAAKAGRMVPVEPAEDVRFLDELTAKCNPPLTAGCTIDDMRDRAPEVLQTPGCAQRLRDIAVRYKHRPLALDGIDPLDVATWCAIEDDRDCNGQPILYCSRQRNRYSLALREWIKEVRQRATKQNRLPTFITGARAVELIGVSESVLSRWQNRPPVWAETNPIRFRDLLDRQDGLYRTGSVLVLARWYAAARKHDGQKPTACPE